VLIAQMHFVCKLACKWGRFVFAFSVWCTKMQNERLGRLFPKFIATGEFMKSPNWALSFIGKEVLVKAKG